MRSRPQFSVREAKEMRLDPRQSAKLGRMFSYIGVALMAAWSMLALAAYAGIEATLAWLAGQFETTTWFTSVLAASADIDGPLIALIWAGGAVLLIGLTLGLCRATS